MPLENEIFPKACHVIILVAKAWALKCETGNRRNLRWPMGGQGRGLLRAGACGGDGQLAGRVPLEAASPFILLCNEGSVICSPGKVTVFLGVPGHRSKIQTAKENLPTQLLPSPRLPPTWGSLSKCWGSTWFPRVAEEGRTIIKAASHPLAVSAGGKTIFS